MRIDKSSQAFTDDGKGNYVITERDANQKTIGTIWAKDDGSHGVERVDSQQNKNGTVTQRDGSFSNYTVNADGGESHYSYDKDKKFLGSDWKWPDGSVGSTKTFPDGTLVILAKYVKDASFYKAGCTALKNRQSISHGVISCRPYFILALEI